MSPKTLFITGTDTNVGKTLIATALLKAANAHGLSTAAIKPVAAGCVEQNGEWVNDDALALQAACSLDLSYQEVNPVALKSAIAPHLAAEQEGRNISVDRLVGFSRGVLSKKADLTVIEGAGGWRVPLNNREYFSTYVQQIQTPVILVVGIRLGCINHTLLTLESITRDGLTVAGWVANIIEEDMPQAEENIQTLKERISVPCLATLTFNKAISAKDVAQALDINALIA